MEPIYAAQYRQLYDQHWWWRTRERILLDILVQHYTSEKDLRILDVGCGDGLFFPRLKRFGVVKGIESDHSLITERGLAEGEIYVGFFNDDYPEDEKYDLILMLDVIEHVNDPFEMIRKARRCLSTDGRLLITVPAFPSLWTGHDWINRHRRRYTRHSLESLLQKGGFETEDIRYAFHLLAVLKFLIHLFSVHHKKMKFSRRTRIPPQFLNRILITASVLEYQLLSWVRVPFGSSLMGMFRPV